jgi:hypothetical protein
LRAEDEESRRFALDAFVADLKKVAPLLEAADERKRRRAS